MMSEGKIRSEREESHEMEEESAKTFDWRMKRQSEAYHEDNSFCLTPGCRNHVNQSKKRKLPKPEKPTHNHESNGYYTNNGVTLRNAAMNQWSVDHSPFTYTSKQYADSSNFSPLSRFQVASSPCFLPELPFEDDSDPTMYWPFDMDRENIPPGICTPESSVSTTPSPFGRSVSTPKPSGFVRRPRRRMISANGAATPCSGHPAILVGPKRLFGLKNEMEKALKVQELDEQLQGAPKIHISRSRSTFLETSVPPLPLHYPMNDISPRDVAKKLMQKANEDVEDRGMEDMTDEIIKEKSKCQNASPRTWPQCVICLEEEANTVLVRCGHLCMCCGCAQKQWLGPGQGTCPICRNTIQQLLYPL